MDQATVLPSDGARPADRPVLVCNYAEPTSACPAGAKAYVVRLYYRGPKPHRAKIVARSRSGRWIETIENLKRLRDFRVKAIPPEHPRYGDVRIRWGEGHPATLFAALRGDDEADRESTNQSEATRDSLSTTATAGCGTAPAPEAFETPDGRSRIL